MLDQLPTEDLSTYLVRLASRRDVKEFFEDQKLDESSIDEIMQFLKSLGVATGIENVVDRMFAPKRRLAKVKYRTRFSDGTFPVLYGAIEAQTAEAEVEHWFRKHVGTHARTAFYVRIRYRFSGKVKDLRPKKTAWPALTNEKDYRFCNDLGADAVAAGLDGLLAPSARNDGGTNLPAFVRRAVDEFSEGRFVALTYDPASGKTTLREV